VGCCDADSLPDTSDVSREYKDIVLCAGRLVPGKNVNRLVEAFAMVRTSLTSRLVICGEGVLRQGIERQVNSLGLDSCTTLTGHLSHTQLFGLMRAAAVLVSLSDYEGFPNVIAEAMACDCPLVLSDIPAHRDLVPHDCGVFVNPQNAGEVAEAIKETLQERSPAVLRAKRAKVRIKSFSVASMANQYEHLYYDLVARSQLCDRQPAGRA
jgi:glycosyltransferase involved in cell wall biosynthesis